MVGKTSISFIGGLGGGKPDNHYKENAEIQGSLPHLALTLPSFGCQPSLKVFLAS